MLKQQQLRLATLTGTRGGKYCVRLCGYFIGLGGVRIPELSKSFPGFSKDGTIIHGDHDCLKFLIKVTGPHPARFRTQLTLGQTNSRYSIMYYTEAANSNL
jgi:hypothetical protein